MEQSPAQKGLLINMPVEAVIFDMDGTVLDTELFTLEAWPDAASERGYEIDAELAARLVGINEATGKSILAERFGSAFPYDAIHGEMERRYRLIVERDGIPVKKGFFELKRKIEERSLPFILATSTRRSVAEWKLLRAGLQNEFPLIICGDEIENGKPHPEIFIKAARILGKPPQVCVGIEDSDVGLMSLHNAGIRSVFIKDLVTPSPQTMASVWRVFSDLGEVSAIL